MAAILRAVDFGTDRWIEAGDARLFVRIWGGEGGRDVLYWHGVGLTSPAGASLGEAAPQLARGHGLRVLALDAPGFGRSPALEPSRYHPHSLADLVPPLLDALGLECVAFLGYSWGGDVGCHVAARHPERLSALVLLDAAYRDPPFDAALPYAHYLERNRELAERTEGVTVDPGVIAAVEHGIAQALPSTTTATIPVPVLLVADAATGEDDLARFRADVPHADVIRPREPGHNVLGAGGPETVHDVGDWLEEAR
jgi:pimeloyl-ACP methyl ester carboxylesterase